MNSEIKKAKILCESCGAELLVAEDKVFCQTEGCKNADGSFKQIKPKYAVDNKGNFVEIAKKGDITRR